MRIQWFYLALALAILLPPMPFSPAFQKSLRSSQRRNLASSIAALTVWQNWLDLIRAAMGSYLLTQKAIVADPLRAGGELNAGVVISALLGLGVLVQIVRGVRSVQLLGPVFYLSGMTLVLGGPLQGPFALVVGWAFALVGKKLAYQLPAMFMALIIAGGVLGWQMLLVVDCGLILMPWLLAALLRKRLLFAVRTPATA